MSLNQSPPREERHLLRADIRLSSHEHQLAESVMTDISLSGLGTDGLLHFRPETHVRVQFPDGSVRSGRTMWHEGFYSGFQFDQPMDEAELARLKVALTRQPRFTETGKT